MNSICFNGKMFPADQPVLLASNRGYRYGDGLFETIRVRRGAILLAGRHFERLFSGLSLLRFEMAPLFTGEKLEEEILRLCRKNECERSARVRLSVSRGNGGLYDGDKTGEYLIECWPLEEQLTPLNENGLIIDVFPDAMKSCDRFSNLKSSSHQPYSLAALFAKSHRLNDCLVLNVSGRVADSTIANVFLIKDDEIITPALEEGCIGGVMRGYLLEKLIDWGYTVRESMISVEDMTHADEVFLTNAIRGIRWVGQFRDKTYTNPKTVEIYNRFVKATGEDGL